MSEFGWLSVAAAEEETRTESRLADRLAKALDALRDECDVRGWRSEDPEMMGVYAEACAALVEYDDHRCDCGPYDPCPIHAKP